jgi:predicted metalloprotease with PDZ domain
MKPIRIAVQRASEDRPILMFLAEFPDVPTEGFELQLPVWRPGRYELGNFAANVYSVDGLNAAGHWVRLLKCDLHRWTVPAGISRIRWSVYAEELNAGSTCVEPGLVYINPVNCILYDPTRTHLPFTLVLTDVKEHWQVATALPHQGNLLAAKNLQELMDSPILAAEQLWHRMYKVQSYEFHVWIYGNQIPDEERFINDHVRFTTAQIEAFGTFPVPEYHFLYLFPERVVRHGVEHEASTVIAMGPSEKVQTEEGYMEVIGIASHELYHTWNVKKIRPSEWLPYDFTKACPSRLGYVAEGVTTYMGDLFLLESGIVDVEGWCKLMEGLIDRHLNNAGRYNLSVAESSYDTWLDGYKPGVPERKSNIYVEGAILAFICDVAIMDKTGEKSSLQTAMTVLWERLGQQGIGLTENIYWAALDQCIGEVGALAAVRGAFCNGTGDTWVVLRAAMKSQGLELSRSQDENGVWKSHLERVPQEA